MSIPTKGRADRSEAGCQEEVPSGVDDSSRIANGNARIAQLFPQGERHIMEKLEPTDQDLVGFGKYSDLQTIHVWNFDFQYLAWCQSNMAEGGTCRRMGAMVCKEVGRGQVHTSLSSQSSGAISVNTAPSGRI